MEAHRHTFVTNEGRTIRVCKKCGARQEKIAGRWTQLGHLGLRPRKPA